MCVCHRVRVCLDYVLVLCLVMGYVLQFRETAHKRIHYHYYNTPNRFANIYRSALSFTAHMYLSPRPLQQYCKTLQQYSKTIPQYNKTIPQYGKNLQQYSKTLQQYSKNLQQYSKTYNSIVRTYSSIVRPHNSIIRPYHSIIQQRAGLI